MYPPSNSTPPYSNGTATGGHYYPNATAPPAGAYPSVQPLAAQTAAVPTAQVAAQQQQQHYPSLQPLAAENGQPSAPPMAQYAAQPPASAGGDISYAYPSQPGAHALPPPLPPQQQQQQPYPSMTPQQPTYQQGQQQQQQQQQGAYQALTNTMQTLSLQQHGQPSDGNDNSAHSYSQQQQQPYPQQAPPGAGSASPSQLYPSVPNGSTSYHNQQQQPAYTHCSSSGNSQHYGSYNNHHNSSFAASSFNSTGGSITGQQQQQWAAQPPSPAAAPAAYPPAAVSSQPSGVFGSMHPQQQPQQQQAYQQQALPLPPYPAVPQAGPVMPYTISPDKVPQGYDVMLYIQNAKNLPAMDWWNGLADPYVIITSHIGGHKFEYRTAHKRNTVNPEYDNEFFQMANLPKDTTFFVEVWDKDVVTSDDVIGRSSWSFNPQKMLPVSTAGGGLLNEDQSWGLLQVKLPLKHPSKASKGAGEIELEVCYRPSTRMDGQPRMLGPVRFRQHLSPTAGVFTGHWWSNANTMSFSTFKLFLTNITGIFGDFKMHWNNKYDKAVAIFKNPVVLSGVRTQHSALYSTHMGSNRGGVLSSAADFFELFSNGIRGGERRFFTYVLAEDSFRCSETGAAFFSDMFSKHAMHSNGAEEVLYAGEFCIVPCPEAAGGHKLVIDNNSGTYAPDKAKLPLMKELFCSNFPDMTVEVLDMKDPRLKEYQLACPSRAC